MEISVDETPRYLLVRARGDLGPGTVTVLRDAVLMASAEQPRGLVCDLRDVHARRESLGVLTTVADRVADWPAAPFAVVASGGGLIAQLDRLGLRRRLPVVTDLRQAASALRRSPRMLVAVTDLPPTVHAPALARAFVGTTLAQWGVHAVVEGARWVASELATNAVVHAGTDLTLRVCLAGRQVSVAVADRGRGGAVRAGSAALSGLRVVEQLSRSWGVQPRFGDGTVVYAVLDADVPVLATVPQQGARRGQTG